MLREIVNANGRKVTVDDTPEMHKKVFEAVLEWYKHVDAFSGESVMQMDVPQCEAAPFLSDLADDVLEFKTEWTEQ